MNALLTIRTNFESRCEGVSEMLINKFILYELDEVSFIVVEKDYWENFERILWWLNDTM